LIGNQLNNHQISHGMQLGLFTIRKWIYPRGKSQLFILPWLVALKSWESLGFDVDFDSAIKPLALQAISPGKDLVFIVDT
jgi:hypothetical protein